MTGATIRPILHEHSGERRLYLAVLEDALSRLAGANPEGVPLVRLAAQRSEVRDWVAARGASTPSPGDGEEYPFTFEGVCAALGLAVSPLRAAILDGRRVVLSARGAKRVEKRPRLSGQGR